MDARGIDVVELFVVRQDKGAPRKGRAPFCYLALAHIAAFVLSFDGGRDSAAEKRGRERLHHVAELFEAMLFIVVAQHRLRSW